MLRTLRNSVSLDTLLLVYYGHVQSHLNYGVILWGNHTAFRRLLLLQKRAVRIINGAKPRDHCKPLFVRNCILTLPSLYVLACLCYVKKNLNDFNSFSDIHYYSTRNNSNLYQPKCKYSATQHNFSYTSVKLFNHLPQAIRNLSFLTFKRTVQDKFLAKPLYTVSEYFDLIW